MIGIQVTLVCNSNTPNSCSSSTWNRYDNVLISRSWTHTYLGSCLDHQWWWAKRFNRNEFCYCIFWSTRRGHDGSLFLCLFRHNKYFPDMFRTLQNVSSDMVGTFRRLVRTIQYNNIFAALSTLASCVQMMVLVEMTDLPTRQTVEYKAKEYTDCQICFACNR